MSLLRHIFGKSYLNTILLESFLLSTCLIGDNASTFVSGRYKDNFFLRGIIDSSTHGLVALFSWALVENSNFDIQKSINCFAALVFGVCVDLDHFYAANSIRLKAAMSLQHRPPLHLSTIIPVVSGTLWILSILLKIRYLKTLSLIFIVSVFSHHLRDATRRGFWLWPFQNTRAVPYVIYIAVTMLLPFLVRVISLEGRLTSTETPLRSEEEVEVVIH